MNSEPLFGTDGIRGVANRDYLTPDSIVRIARAMTPLLRANTESGANHVIVGRDTRISGALLESALCAGLQSCGIDCWLVGVVPTPAVAFLTQKTNALGGVSLSASHNPYHDNGIKFFKGDGTKLSESEECAVAQRYFSEKFPPHLESIPVGISRHHTSALDQYIDHLISTLPASFTLHTHRIAFDGAQGASGNCGYTLLKAIGARIHRYPHRPDGTNINDRCGSTHPATIQQLVLENKAEIGIALDGDGDRLLLCDEKGELCDGDTILAMLAEDLLEKGRLPHRSVVGTVMTNGALDTFLHERGATLYRTPVGDRHIWQKMSSSGFALGGEPSGHLILHPPATTGDGLLIALRCLAILGEKGISLGEWKKRYQPFPSLLTNLPISHKPPLEEVAPLQEALRAAQKKLSPYGRVLLRYSGTEPKIRLLLEGPEKTVLQEESAKLQRAIQNTLQ